MATRTVRLDKEDEAALRQIQISTGMPISRILKSGIHSLKQRSDKAATQTPYEIFGSLDLGPGGYAIAPSTQSSKAVRAAIRKKLGR